MKRPAVPFWPQSARAQWFGFHAADPSAASLRMVLFGARSPAQELGRPHVTSSNVEDSAVREVRVAFRSTDKVRAGVQCSGDTGLKIAAWWPARTPITVARVARSPNLIEYDGTFSFPVSIERLWETVARLDQISSWWGWLHDYSVEGETLEAGTVLHGVVAPPLPYRMTLDVVLGECVPKHSIAAKIHGDLEGAAHLMFSGNERSTSAHATWTIEMMQQPMRLAARFGHPLLRWGHDRVVEATVDGFRRSALGLGR